jgi:two-component system CheB/CheR fusion protein
MARPGLRRELTAALHQAVRTGEIVSRPGLRVKTNGDYTAVNLTLRPLPAASAEGPLYVVILEEAAGAVHSDQLPVISDQLPENSERLPAHGEALALVSPAAADRSPGAVAEASITALKQELRAKEEYLQTANEELETSNEELKSSNEEMQSVNEELQSTNEELETSKEELQSVNEELATVNAELQTKVGDLSRVNNDMNNLLAGTGIGTVFVDHHLRILRFTPSVTRVINLIHSDVGRPLGHTVSNLVGYDRLVEDVQEVLDTLVPETVDVRTKDGLWYALRILPYRTLDNVIEGAVLTFAEITEVVRTREALRQANDLLRLAVVVRDAHDAITVQDFNGRIQAWNPGAVRLYGWSEAEAMAMNVRDRIPSGRATAEEMVVVHQLAVAGEALEPYRTQRLAKDGSVIEIWLTATALLDEHRNIYAIATTERLSS